jgi:rod shape-determining protein MreC
MGGIFPPDYPVAEVTRVERAAAATFAIVEARPTAGLGTNREVLLVWFKEPPPPDVPTTPAGEAGAGAAAAPASAAAAAPSPAGQEPSE